MRPTGEESVLPNLVPDCRPQTTVEQLYRVTLHRITNAFSIQRSRSNNRNQPAKTKAPEEISGAILYLINGAGEGVRTLDLILGKEKLKRKGPALKPRPFVNSAGPGG